MRCLDAAERAAARGDFDEIAQALTPLPIELIALLYFDRPVLAERWPTLIRWLPSLPEAEDIELWTGSKTAWDTMHQAAVFVGDALAKLERSPLDLRVLDYGCGWGRMIRLLYARFRVSNICAVDPWPPSAQRLQTLGVHCTFSPVEAIPTEALPFQEPFDLIYAYSVFTHIGPDSVKAVLANMRRHIKSDGLVVLTVRQGNFWTDMKGWPGEERIAKLLDEHLTHGFTHIRNPPKEGGLSDYGSTSISVDYIREQWTDWRLEDVQWRAGDAYQTIVYLRPA